MRDPGGRPTGRIKVSYLVSVPLRGKEGAGRWGTAGVIAALSPQVSWVSVPLRGKEGAGHSLELARDVIDQLFPSPCGVRRVRDIIASPAGLFKELTVSVPLRGKEGAGQK